MASFFFASAVLSASWLPALRRAATVALTCAGLAAQAQGPATVIFQEDAEARAAASTSPLMAALRAARPFTLNTATMMAALAAAPMEGRGGEAVVLALPLPGGGSGRFAVVEAPVMAPPLAEVFPDIKTYAGYGLDDATASVRLDMTPRGFHAQVLAADGGTFYIDPVTRTDTRHYLSFYRHDMNRAATGQAGLACGYLPNAADQAATAQRLGAAGSVAQRATGTTLRTYRLAVAATKEYTAFHGGTVARGQAAVVTTVNRVVGVYEKELAVRLVLVANNNLLIYTTANPGPYSPPNVADNNPDLLLRQNQTNIDAVIGAANYDIGHVVGVGGGGLADLGVVCEPGFKAQGETGDTNPVGDAFDIDYVAHEMGHQFGADHSFNSNSGAGACGGNRGNNTAYEPGGGTTIMAYAGICGNGSDLQNNSDAYFHATSYQEIQAYLATTACAVNTPTGNLPPVVVGPASGKTLPISTPFKLTATGTDANGDALTYCWEQYDLGPAGTATATQVAGQNVPIFRSFTATTSPTRYFPKLANTIAGTTTIGERLPTVSRNLTFRCTVRDQHVGGAGIIGGVNVTAPNISMAVVSTAGPFTVSAPNATSSWPALSTQTVTWNVANTNVPPVNCQLVNIRLSTDGGLTYPTILAANVPNSGSATLTLPNMLSTRARVMVEAADNYFFNISNANFTLAARLGTASAQATAFAVYPNPASAGRALHLTVDVPAAAYVLRNVLGQTLAARAFSGTATDVPTAGLAAGVYLLTVQAGGQAPATRRVVVE